MNNIAIKSLYFLLFFFPFRAVLAQTEPGDYWLNNGFSSGQTVYTNSGFFYDDGGYDLYNMGQNWNVTFCSENGNPITFDFNGFRTIYGGGSYTLWDYMTINYTGTVPLVAYDNDTPQFSFTAPTGCIQFGFRSRSAGVPDSGWIAEISANPPPVNNDPCDAILLNVDNVCSPSFYSNKGAWDTRNLGSPSCHQFFGGDVWFSAVVPASGSLKIETLQGSLRYAIMVLYRGNCNSLTQRACVDNPGNMPVNTFTGLTAGETVYIRIFGDQAKSGTFGICATDPAAEITGYTGPGGVGDSISNRLWLRADSGPTDALMNPVSNGSNVYFWLDRSGNNNHLKQGNTASQPLFNSLGLNGRQTLTFDGSQTFMTDTLVASSSPIGIFTVNSYAISKDQSVLALGNASDLNTLSISRENISNQYYTFTNTKNYGQALPSAPHVLFARHDVTAPYHTYKLNGAEQTVYYSEEQVSTNGALYIGVDKDDTDFLDGNISEVIIYSKRLNAAQELIVTNYLAAKYALTISNDRYEYQDTHPYDLAGIGRIDQGNIHSRAMSAGILSIGGASDLGNNEFLLFAHNGDDFNTWTSSGIPAGDNDIIRLAREWRVDITGDGPGTLSLTLDTTILPPLPEGFIAYNLLIDADGNFENGAQTYGLFSIGKELIANNIELTDGCFIAISAVRAKINFSLASSSGLESIERPEISVELNHAVSEPVQVNYSVISGTAERGVDYSLNDGSLLFNPGEKIKSIVPLIFDDNIVEIPDEYFTIQISGPTGGVLAGDTLEHRYTIIDNDLSLYITASDSIIGECSTSITTLTANAAGKEPLAYSWSPIAGLSDPSSAITIANPSVNTMYKVTVTDALGGVITDSLLITVQPVPPQPSISVAGDLVFCDGESVQLSGPDGYTYLWSNGSFSQSIDANESGNYSLIVTDENGCSSLPSNEVVVIVHPNPDKPVISVIGNTVFCGGDSVTLVAPEGYDYLWNTGATSRTIVTGIQGDYSVMISDANSCTSASSDSVNVIVHPLPSKPEIQASGPVEFCEGTNVTLSAPNGFEYIWSDGQTTQSIIIDRSDTLTLTVMDGNGCHSLPSEQVIVKVNPLPLKPVVAVNGDLNLCEGETVELFAPEGYSYLWSNGETTRNLNVTVESSYSVRVTDTNGCESEPSEAVVVSVTPTPPKPVIAVNGELRICENQSIELSAPEGYSYTWSTGASSQTIVVNTTGSYTVVVSTGNCASPPSDPVDILVDEIPEKPVLGISGPLEFCEGGSVELTAPEGFSYIWSNGETTRSILISESGSYKVALLNGTCISDSSDLVEVVVNPKPLQPVITYNTALDFCEGGSVLLVAPDGYQEYNWSNGFSGKFIDVTETGNYYVTVTDNKGCVSDPSPEVSVTVSTRPPKPVISYIGDVEFCEGESLTLSAPSGYTYLWTNGAESQDIIVSQQGSYSVIVYNEGCPSDASEALNIIVNPIPPKPSITPSGPINLITGQSVNLTSTLAYEYLWSTSETSREIAVSSTGEYTLRISDEKGCQSPLSDPVLVTVSDKYPAPVVSVEGETSFCEGESVMLTSEEAFAYVWSNGETTRNIIISEAGNYTVFTRDVNGFESEHSAPVTVTVYENPIATANVMDVNCYGGSDGSATLQVTGGAAPYSADWSGGQSGLSVSGLQAGNYSSIVTDANGCSIQIELQVNQPEELTINAMHTNAYCPDAEDGTITLTISGGTPEYLIRWENGSTQKTVSGLAAGNYPVTVSDAKNCEKSATFDVGIVNEFCFSIPDIITPNNDGKNDTWVIEGLEFYPGVTVEIYDRWGKRVFYSKGYDKDFDGALNGKELPMESYHYIINLNNGTPVIIGNITIVR